MTQLHGQEKKTVDLTLDGLPHPPVISSLPSASFSVFVVLSLPFLFFRCLARDHVFILRASYHFTASLLFSPSVLLFPLFLLLHRFASLLLSSSRLFLCIPSFLHPPLSSPFLAAECMVSPFQIETSQELFFSFLFVFSSARMDFQDFVTFHCFAAHPLLFLFSSHLISSYPVSPFFPFFFSVLSPSFVLAVALFCGSFFLLPERRRKRRNGKSPFLTFIRQTIQREDKRIAR